MYDSTISHPIEIFEFFTLKSILITHNYNAITLLIVGVQFYLSLLYSLIPNLLEIMCASLSLPNPLQNK